MLFGIILNMKKHLLTPLFIILIATASVAAAKDYSANVAYTLKVIQALGYSDQAMSIEYVENEALDSVTSKMASQTSLLERAKAELSPYQNSDDLLQKIGADIITNNINSQIDLNQRQLSVYAKYKDKISEEDFTEEEWNDMISELDSGEHKDWTGVITQAQFAVLELVVLPNTGEHKGKITYKITKADKNRLLKKIDELFGTKIREITRNPDNHFYDSDEPKDNILLSAYRMRNILGSQTFEEIYKKNRLWGSSGGSLSK